MTVLVTTGTTPFEGLIKSIDGLDNPEWTFKYQIALGSKYLPSSDSYFFFSDKIEQLYISSDIVVCHAGAGTVFKLLEMKKMAVVVPNSERRDKHQLDLANYVDTNDYAIVCYDVKNIGDAILKARDFRPKVYIKEEFFKDNFLNKIIADEYGFDR